MLAEADLLNDAEVLAKFEFDSEYEVLLASISLILRFELFGSVSKSAFPIYTGLVVPNIKLSLYFEVLHFIALNSPFSYFAPSK